jgi:hypothetical protein
MTQPTIHVGDRWQSPDGQETWFIRSVPTSHGWYRISTQLDMGDKYSAEVSKTFLVEHFKRYGWTKETT